MKKRDMNWRAEINARRFPTKYSEQGSSPAKAGSFFSGSTRRHKMGEAKKAILTERKKNPGGGLEMNNEFEIVQMSGAGDSDSHREPDKKQK